MVFSIITTTYNDVENLKITYKSVAIQNYKDYEYLIVDGGSSDGTVEYLEEIAAKDTRVRYISEPDRGIYDAMNKGVAFAKGDYIVFLGAADRFYSSCTLKETAELLKSPIDILYGRCVYSSGDRVNQKSGYKLSFINILLDKYVAHQSVFAKRELLKKYPFDLRYTVQADQDFMLRMRKIKCKMKFVNKIFAFYDGRGFSSDMIRDCHDAFLNERIEILKVRCPSIYFIRQCGHLIMKHSFY